MKGFSLWLACGLGLAAKIRKGFTCSHTHSWSISSTGWSSHRSARRHPIIFSPVPLLDPKPNQDESSHHPSISQSCLAPGSSPAKTSSHKKRKLARPLDDDGDDDSSSSFGIEHCRASRCLDAPRHRDSRSSPGSPPFHEHPAVDQANRDSIVDTTDRDHSRSSNRVGNRNNSSIPLSQGLPSQMQTQSGSSTSSSSPNSDHGNIGICSNNSNGIEWSTASSPSAAYSSLALDSDPVADASAADPGLPRPSDGSNSPFVFSTRTSIIAEDGGMTKRSSSPLKRSASIMVADPDHPNGEDVEMAESTQPSLDDSSDLDMQQPQSVRAMSSGPQHPEPNNDSLGKSLVCAKPPSFSSAAMLTIGQPARIVHQHRRRQ